MMVKLAVKSKKTKRLCIQGLNLMASKWKIRRQTWHFFSYFLLLSNESTAFDNLVHLS